MTHCGMTYAYRYGKNLTRGVNMKHQEELLNAYVMLFKEFAEKNNTFMATNILNKISEHLVLNCYTLDQAMEFYKTNLNEYLK